ncbi:MAG: FMN-binding glutamate synthase family protein [Methanotrichaceae archaeon]|nr:FMN-binding glutamate synthase family protein [Methanotrichaceae archaeon]
MANWTKIVLDRIAKVPVSGGRTSRTDRISFSDLVFVPAQLAKRPVDYFKEPISVKTLIGKTSAKPFEIETPIIISAMSFGALSREAKIALAKASTLAGTIENTGEGGVLPEEREFSRRLIVQYSTGRFGITEDVLKKADMIEIKIGQGAKGGQGGLLPKEKVTAEIAKVRNVSQGQDIHSPAYHQDIKTPEDLKKKVDWLRQISGGTPIGIKLAAADVENDIKIAVFANADIISVDGHEGGTGAAPVVMLNEVGVPTLPALVRARKMLDKLGAKQELWIGGGFYEGGAVAKALALGADAVFMGSGMLEAFGCVACNLCYLGKCPKGIATQDEELRKNLNIEIASQNVANYIKNCTEEVKMAAGACGHDDVHKLNKDDLRALTWEMSKISGAKFVAD